MRTVNARQIDRFPAPNPVMNRETKSITKRCIIGSFEFAHAHHRMLPAIDIAIDIAKPSAYVCRSAMIPRSGDAIMRPREKVETSEARVPRSPPISRT